MVRLLGRLAHRLFYHAAGPQTAGAIIRRWERRRLVYNLYLTLIGVPSLFLFYAILAQPGMV
jgi:hypothetical protein